MSEQLPPAPYPHYGSMPPAKPPKKPMKKRDKVAATIVAGFLLILFGHSLGNSPPQDAVPAAAPQYANLNAGTTEPAQWVGAPAAASAAAPIVINPKIVADAVDANKARAAQDWDDKFVQFTAEVTDISTAFSSTVQFGKVSGQAFSMIQIVCYTGDEAALVPFTKGQKATVRGVIKVGYAGVIQLNNCEKVG